MKKLLALATMMVSFSLSAEGQFWACSIDMTRTAYNSHNSAIVHAQALIVYAL